MYLEFFLVEKQLMIEQITKMRVIKIEGIFIIEGSAKMDVTMLLDAVFYL